MNQFRCIITGCVLRNRDTGQQWNGDAFTFPGGVLVNCNPGSEHHEDHQDDSQNVLWFIESEDMFERRAMFVFINNPNATWGFNPTALRYIGGRRPLN
jgi:hypothetical protein